MLLKRTGLIELIQRRKARALLDHILWPKGNLEQEVFAKNTNVIPGSLNPGNRYSNVLTFKGKKGAKSAFNIYQQSHCCVLLSAWECHTTLCVMAHSRCV